MGNFCISSPNIGELNDKPEGALKEICELLCIDSRLDLGRL